MTRWHENADATLDRTPSAKLYPAGFLSPARSASTQALAQASTCTINTSTRLLFWLEFTPRRLLNTRDTGNPHMAIAKTKVAKAMKTRSGHENKATSLSALTQRR